MNYKGLLLPNHIKKPTSDRYLPMNYIAYLPIQWKFKKKRVRPRLSTTTLDIFMRQHTKSSS